MVYAHRADIYDADTHDGATDLVGEFADANLRPHLTPFGQSKHAAIEKAEQALLGFAKRQQTPDLAAKSKHLGDEARGFQGLGAWDRDKRVRVNDLLGFNAHIVFPTAAFDQVQGARDLEILLVRCDANRGLASFCATDARMHPAAYVPFRHGPELAMTYLDAAIAQTLP